MGVIENGYTGIKLKIDANNRLHGSVITEPQADHHSELGFRANINSGPVNLTNASESGVLYIKNNEEKDLIITALIYNVGPSTSGTLYHLIEVYKNTTDGTIVTPTPTAVDMEQNMNFGSSRTLTVDAYQGAQGETQTGGTLAIQSFISPSGVTRAVVSLGAMVLTKGDSICVTMTPGASNTSVDVSVAASCFLQQLSV